VRVCGDEGGAGQGIRKSGRWFVSVSARKYQFKSKWAVEESIHSQQITSSHFLRLVTLKAIGICMLVHCLLPETQ
jgi:hypothetical protein